MKKLAFTLFACMAFVQSAIAATPALTESLLEYQAIITAVGSPSFTTIGPNEFIVDIERITKEVNILGTVKYRITTQDTDTTVRCPKRIYIARLDVAPNPDIGPNIVTVLSITKCR